MHLGVGNYEIDSIKCRLEDGSGADFVLNYDGVKVNSSTDDNRYIYSKETSQIVKATLVPDGNLYLYLFYAGPDILEK